MTLPFFWPTTIVVIDDDEEILEILSTYLNDAPYNFKFFQNPNEAVSFIKESNNIDNCRYIRNVDQSEYNFQYQEKRISVNLNKLYEEIYNPDRFSIVSCILVDYNMPGMSGLDFIKEIDQYTSAKKVLLTAYLGYEAAIDLKGELIDDYIQKSHDAHLFDKVRKTIDRNVSKFFEKISYPVSLAVKLDHEVSAIDDIMFEQFFNNLCKERNIIEYYLIEDIGCYLLFDRTYSAFILHVEIKERLDASIQEYTNSIPSDKLRLLVDYKYLVCAYKKLQFYYPDSNDVLNYIFPAIKIQGVRDYYVTLYEYTNLDAANKPIPFPRVRSN
ncbi:MAG: response regulator [Rickettsiaceae bacterium]|jgi:CheY-like chemotaxis protein|nr:response regulator [Rickettsiaceae bacterium]